MAWLAEHPRNASRLIVATDQADTYYPWDVAVSRGLRHFHIPMWNPNSFGGTPLWTNGQPSPLYPIRVITSFLMKPPLQHGFFIFFDILIGGFGIYFLCRSMKYLKISSIAASLAWMYSPMSFAWMQFEFFLPLIAYTPFIFLGCNALFKNLEASQNKKLIKRIISVFPIIALIIWLQTMLFLGSNIQFVMFVMAPVAIFLAFKLIALRYKELIVL